MMRRRGGVGVGIWVPPVVVAPAPVYVAPPVVYAPPPAYYPPTAPGLGAAALGRAVLDTGALGVTADGA
jgi:hypothetical protein